MRKSFAGAVVLLGGFLLFSAGCATTGHKGSITKKTALTRKPAVAAPKKKAVTSKPAPPPSRPAWVTKKDDYWVQGRQIMYRGYSVDKDRTTALKEAESAARERLAKNVRDLMLAEFRREIAGQKVNAKTSETLAASFREVAGNSKIAGITRADWHVEKASYKSARRTGVAYRVFVLMKISMTDYDKCLRQTLAALRAKVAGKRGERKLVEAVNARLPENLL